jgi:hypothetical protein
MDGINDFSIFMSIIYSKINRSMKKLLILASMLILIGVGKSMAGQADLFSYDGVAIENQMAQMDQLEGYVLSNPGVTLGEMSTSGNALASLVSDPNGVNGFQQMNEKVFGVPSFLWGCLFSVAGVALVYFMGGQDMAETKMAIYGCVVEGVLWGGYILVWNVILGRSYWW